MGTTAGFRGGTHKSVALCYLGVMSQPVKLSDALVLDARVAGDVLQRSIAGQVEFWARLGRALEPVLKGDQVLALSRSGAVRSLTECIELVDSVEGRQRVAEYLRERPYPHYEAAPSRPGILVRVEVDGTRTVGRFVNRNFEAANEQEQGEG